MTVWLPENPRPMYMNPTYMVSGKDNTSPNGVIQRVQRIGDKWKISVPFKSVNLNRYNDDFIPALMQAANGKVYWYILQPKKGVGTVGNPVVNGSASGNSLPIRGGSPNYTYKRGQWISIVHNSLVYLHMVYADVTLNGSGVGVVSILPPIRPEQFSDGDIVEVSKPRIEGYVSQENLSWSRGSVDVVSFDLDIVEGQ